VAREEARKIFWFGSSRGETLVLSMATSASVGDPSGRVSSVASEPAALPEVELAQRFHRMETQLEAITRFLLAPVPSDVRTAVAVLPPALSDSSVHLPGVSNLPQVSAAAISNPALWSYQIPSLDADFIHLKRSLKSVQLLHSLDFPKELKGKKFSVFARELSLIKDTFKACLTGLRVALSEEEKDVPDLGDFVLVFLKIMRDLVARHSAIFIQGQYSKEVMDEFLVTETSGFLVSEQLTKLERALRLTEAKSTYSRPADGGNRFKYSKKNFSSSKSFSAPSTNKSTGANWKSTPQSTGNNN